MQDRTLVLESLGGGNNLKYRLQQYATGICSYYVIMDGDQKGCHVVEESLKEKLLSPADYRIVTVPDQKESEIEDLIYPELYLSALNEEFGLRLTSAQVRKRKSKWSTRIEALFQKSGKVFSASTKRDVKVLVADAVSANPRSALLDATFIKDVVADLRERLH